MVARRRELALRYHELLDGLPVRPVRDPVEGASNYQSFWVELPATTPALAQVLTELAAAGVSARRGIMAAHLEPAYADHPHRPLPITERLTRRTVILPLYHEMTSADQDTVVAALGNVLAGQAVAV
jgi:perosamine synthetase